MHFWFVFYHDVHKTHEHVQILTAHYNLNCCMYSAPVNIYRTTRHDPLSSNSYINIVLTLSLFQGLQSLHHVCCCHAE